MKKIIEESWDYLIVLDACRFDYFEELYERYLEGSLEKRVSPIPASSSFPTKEWCEKVFGDRYHEDIVYVSGHPGINSKTGWGDFAVKGHVYKVIDVWDWGWGENMLTVHPKSVTKAAIEAKEKYPSKRFIVHYMQPHAPFVCLEDIRYERENPIQKIRSYIKTDGSGDSETHGIYSSGRVTSEVKAGPAKIWELAKLTYIRTIFDWFFIQTIIGKIAKTSTLWKIRRWFKLPPLQPLEDAVRKYDQNEIRRAYRRNLEFVLEYVGKLVECLSGSIVITSDHGELLGEYGEYGHTITKTVTPLMDVPWFEVAPSEDV